MEADFSSVIVQLRKNNDDEEKRDGYRLNQATAHSKKNTELLEKLTSDSSENIKTQNELSEGNESLKEEGKQERDAQNSRLVDGLNKIGSGIKGLIQRSKDFVGETPSVIKALLTAGAFFALAKFLQSDFVKKVVVNIVLRLKKLVTDIMGLFEGEFTFGKLFDVIKDNFLTILGVLTVLKPKMMFNLIKSSLFGLAGLIDKVGKDGDDAVKQSKMSKAFGKLKSSFKGLGEGLKNFGNKISTGIENLKKGSADKALKGMFSKVKNGFVKAGDSVAGFMNKAGSKLKSGFSGLDKFLSGGIKPMMAKAKVGMIGFFASMKSVIIGAFSTLKGMLLANPLTAILVAVGIALALIGSYFGFFNPLIDGIMGIFKKIRGFFVGIYNSFAESRIGRYLGLNPITDDEEPPVEGPVPDGTENGAGNPVPDPAAADPNMPDMESPAVAEKALSATEMATNAASKLAALMGGQKGSQIIQTNVNNSKTTSSKNVSSKSTSIIDNNPIYRTVTSQATA